MRNFSIQTIEEREMREDQERRRLAAEEVAREMADFADYYDRGFLEAARVSWEPWDAVGGSFA